MSKKVYLARVCCRNFNYILGAYESLFDAWNATTEIRGTLEEQMRESHDCLFIEEISYFSEGERKDD